MVAAPALPLVLNAAVPAVEKGATTTAAIDSVGPDMVVLAVTVDRDFAFSEFYEDFMRVAMVDLVLYGAGVAKHNAEQRLRAYYKLPFKPTLLFSPARHLDPATFEYKPGRAIPIVEDPSPIYVGGPGFRVDQFSFRSQPNRVAP
jgi:hypothetical protein